LTDACNIFHRRRARTTPDGPSIGKTALGARFTLKVGIPCRIFVREDRPDADDQGFWRLQDHHVRRRPQSPHVHVIGPDFQAKVRIRDAVVFAGAIPPRHRREALAWIAANHDPLMVKWNDLK
jgi:Domain of unknown function (DUF4160)